MDEDLLHLPLDGIGIKRSQSLLSLWKALTPKVPRARVRFDYADPLRVNWLLGICRMKSTCRKAARLTQRSGPPVSASLYISGGRASKA
jgi:hypothetical protein